MEEVSQLVWMRPDRRVCEYSESPASPTVPMRIFEMRAAVMCAEIFGLMRKFYKIPLVANGITSSLGRFLIKIARGTVDRLAAVKNAACAVFIAGVDDHVCALALQET